MVVVRQGHAGRAAHQANATCWRATGTQEKDVAAKVEKEDPWLFTAQKGFSAESALCIHLVSIAGRASAVTASGDLVLQSSSVLQVVQCDNVGVFRIVVCQCVGLVDPPDGSHITAVYAERFVTEILPACVHSC